MVITREQFAALEPHLNEKTRRMVAASLTIGGEYGTKGEVSKATGVSYREINRGLQELQEQPADKDRRGGVRKEGGGRKKLADTNPTLTKDMETLLESSTRGDPTTPLRWTTKSLRNLADELSRMGHSISHVTVRALLAEMGYSLQGNRKTLEGAEHPDRNAQFEQINDTVREFQSAGQPVVSVDCKKSELIGNFKNNGREYHRSGEAPEVKDHDFIDKELGKAIPYGVYDMGDNSGFVNVGIDHDTSVFAVESIRQWWLTMGMERYPDATELLITADGGGSNGYRRKLWKTELAKFAAESGLTIRVCHFPSGTSKWNKIEHRLFSQITMNWRGRPLTSIEVIVNLIASTKTRTGLTVKCALDKNTYPTGITVTDEEMSRTKIDPSEFHGEWNYSIIP